MKQPSKYLVRPDDWMVFELQVGGRYQPKNGVTDLEGNRPIPHDNFTEENLIKYGFFPIGEALVEFFEQRCDEHYKKIDKEGMS